MMTHRLIEFFKSKLAGEKPLSSLERRAAKHWVKQRLAHIFPELRNDPVALEKAYRELSLEPRPGAGEGGATLFEIHLPRQF